MRKKSKSLWGHFSTCCSTKYCCFSGRATRAEFWGFQLFSSIFSEGVGNIVQLMDSNLPFLPLIMVGIFFLLPSWGVFVRRMHDIDKSGWNFLWYLVPIYGWIRILIDLCTDSTRHTNQYGPSEKYGIDTEPSVVIPLQKMHAVALKKKPKMSDIPRPRTLLKPVRKMK